MKAIVSSETPVNLLYPAIYRYISFVVTPVKTSNPKHTNTDSVVKFRGIWALHLRATIVLWRVRYYRGTSLNWVWKKGTKIRERIACLWGWGCNTESNEYKQLWYPLHCNVRSQLFASWYCVWRIPRAVSDERKSVNSSHPGQRRKFHLPYFQLRDVRIWWENCFVSRFPRFISRTIWWI
jgi:hypothetical protein